MSFQESVQQDLLVNFRGEARVKIDRLSFPFARRRVRESKVVEIVRLYEKTGCLSLDPEFALPAITDHDHPVNSGAANDGIVRCLHGQHRVEAARRHLDEEAEWLVRYYSSSTWLCLFTGRDDDFMTRHPGGDEITSHRRTTFDTELHRRGDLPRVLRCKR